MPRKSVYRAVADIDRQALAEFQAGIRKRYTDEQILEELLEHPIYQLRLAAMYLKITTCTVLVGDARVLQYLDAYGLGQAAPSVAKRESR